MTLNAFVQIAFYLLVLVMCVRPLGSYMAKVYMGRRPPLEFLFGTIERWLYRIGGVNPGAEMSGRQYSHALLTFSFFGFVATYTLLRFQGGLPLNPESLPGVSPDSSFNTAVSFVTNTNWQSYSGEITMSYFTQMAALAVQNFKSAAIGMALAVAFIRGISRFETENLGNFWADLVRGTLYVLLPFSFLAAIFFMSQGVVQNFKPYDTAQLTESFVVQVDKKDDDGNVIKDANGDNVKEDQTITTQTIAQGPVASQLAIKMLGTNGGGFFNANSAHPFENPTPFSNFIQMLLILIIPAGFTYMLGRMCKSRGHGWAVFGAMMILLIVGVAKADTKPLGPDQA